jgi:predicted DNA-binding transcriptional regulator YafY
MNKVDRLLGILLALRTGRLQAAPDLAAQFEVSERTILRDMDSLAELGIPVYAERGREGGFRLTEGYFLPPIMFSRGEAISLMVALTLLKSLQHRPLASDLAMAEARLLAALPDRLQTILSRAQAAIGFEQLPADIFHYERQPQPAEQTGRDEGQVVTVFLEALLDGCEIRLVYASPYRKGERTYTGIPLALFWDRGHWYLIGQVDGEDHHRNWRADRVVRVDRGREIDTEPSQFDIRDLLGHRWLRDAAETWRAESPVTIRLTRAQADLLKTDWYYGHADFAQQPAGVLMTFGADDRDAVFELLRWLGPGAELISPADWRKAFLEDLRQMIDSYS